MNRTDHNMKKISLTLIFFCCFCWQTALSEEAKKTIIDSRLLQEAQPESDLKEIVKEVKKRKPSSLQESKKLASPKMLDSSKPEMDDSKKGSSEMGGSNNDSDDSEISDSVDSKKKSSKASGGSDAPNASNEKAEKQGNKSSLKAASSADSSKESSSKVSKIKSSLPSEPSEKKPQEDSSSDVSSADSELEGRRSIAEKEPSSVRKTELVPLIRDSLFEKTIMKDDLETQINERKPHSAEDPSTAQEDLGNIEVHWKSVD